MKKWALCLLVALFFITCKKGDSVTGLPDNYSLANSGRWRLKEFRESFGVPVYTWAQPIADTFYVEFRDNNVFKSNVSIFASRTQYQIVNDSMMVLSGNGSDLAVRRSFIGPVLQLDGPCFEPCSYRFMR